MMFSANHYYPGWDAAILAYDITDLPVSTAAGVDRVDTGHSEVTLKWDAGALLTSRDSSERKIYGAFSKTADGDGVMNDLVSISLSELTSPTTAPTLMMGIIGMQIATASGSRNAQDVSVATNLGASKLEELRLSDFATLSSGSQTYLANGSEGSPAYFTVSWTVSALAPKTIDVTVQWQNTAARSIELSTQVAQGTVTK